MMNYPLKFRPILKEKIWGGNKLQTVLHKDTTQSNVGESWEIADVGETISVVSNGALQGMNLKELIQIYTSQFVGTANYATFGTDFPLLIKYIDAKEDLSIQVHPDDTLAKARHNSYGKTEMWYIMQADEDADIVVGFNQEINQAQYQYHVQENNIQHILNHNKVTEGDAFFINAGQIHAIGSGILLAEIQQTSDITYRVYDYDRKNSEGKCRELHTDLALDAIDFENHNNEKIAYHRNTNASSPIVDSTYFTTNFIKATNSLQKNYQNIDSFVIYMCTKGSAEITLNNHTETIATGETLLLPATATQVAIKANHAELLEVFV